MNRKYRKTVIAGNWKMNKTPSETKEFMAKLKAIMPKGRWCDVALCVPAVCIPAAVRTMRETRIGIGAENCNANASGAYTGEIAANLPVRRMRLPRPVYIADRITNVRRRREDLVDVVISLIAILFIWTIGTLASATTRGVTMDVLSFQLIRFFFGQETSDRLGRILEGIVILIHQCLRNNCGNLLVDSSLLQFIFDCILQIDSDISLAHCAAGCQRNLSVLVIGSCQHIHCILNHAYLWSVSVSDNQIMTLFNQVHNYTGSVSNRFPLLFYVISQCISPQCDDNFLAHYLVLHIL